MTVEEFWEFGLLPANAGRAFDLIRGEVVEWPRTGRKHGAVCARIGAALVARVERTGSGFATAGNAGVILARDPATVVGPDLALFADGGTEDPLTGWSLEPPTLAVEVLSPDDDAARVAEKVGAYLAHGVAAVWVVDCEAKEVAVHRPGRPVAVATAGDEFADFGCRVADFFRLPGERGA